ncbi:alpha/beta hydrolase fold domain-containing protein [Paenibacillus sp. S-38]|uniref:alpha/beta hydrolase fold domain-containing protein n=1 Tax=Paenibacillus sp. S-38 TaxID=3416710 RepID=UPI003CF7E04A
MERLPETLIVTAEYDMLRLEGETYAARLAEAGVCTRLIRYRGMDDAFFDKHRAIRRPRTAWMRSQPCLAGLPNKQGITAMPIAT